MFTPSTSKNLVVWCLMCRLKKLNKHTQIYPGSVTSRPTSSPQAPPEIFNPLNFLFEPGTRRHLLALAGGWVIHPRALVLVYPEVSPHPVALLLGILC